MNTPSTYREQFLRITQQKLADIRKRSAAKYSKNGKRLLRPAVPVEITLPAFRGWVLLRFGHEGGSGPCTYCGRWLTPATFVPDHAMPLARGGRNTLDNLVVSCEACNDAKGELTGEAFRALLIFLQDLPDRDAQNIRERLRKSEKLASTVRSMRGRFNPKPAVPTED